MYLSYDISLDIPPFNQTIQQAPILPTQNSQKTKLSPHSTVFCQFSISSHSLFPNSSILPSVIQQPKNEWISSTNRKVINHSTIGLVNQKCSFWIYNTITKIPTPALSCCSTYDNIGRKELMWNTNNMVELHYTAYCHYFTSFS